MKHSKPNSSVRSSPRSHTLASYGREAIRRKSLQEVLRYQSPMQLAWVLLCIASATRRRPSFVARLDLRIRALLSVSCFS